MNYIGQSKLKLYEDISCTKEVEQDISGMYKINIKCITGQPSHIFEKVLYVKNVGTHTAYNISIDNAEGSFEIPNTELKSRKVCYLKVKCNVIKGDKEEKILTARLDYTNLP